MALADLVLLFFSGKFGGSAPPRVGVLVDGGDDFLPPGGRRRVAWLVEGSAPSPRAGVLLVGR